MARTAEQIADEIMEWLRAESQRSTGRHNLSPRELPQEERHLAGKAAELAHQRAFAEFDAFEVSIYADGHRRIAGYIQGTTQIRTTPLSPAPSSS